MLLEKRCTHERDSLVGVDLLVARTAPQGDCLLVPLLRAVGGQGVAFDGRGGEVSSERQGERIQAQVRRRRQERKHRGRRRGGGRETQLAPLKEDCSGGWDGGALPHARAVVGRVPQGLLIRLERRKPHCQDTVKPPPTPPAAEPHYVGGDGHGDGQQHAQAGDEGGVVWPGMRKGEREVW